MQEDFHFYTLYALLRVCGFSSSDSSVIAYASQQVDDADNGREIKIKDGPPYNPVLTAHKALSVGNFSTDVQKKVYMSFHFIPSVDPSTPFNKRDRKNLVTQPDCPISELVLRNALSAKNEKDYPQRLGIALHTYADTWSHQNFSGFNGPENDTEVVEFRTRSRTSLFLRRLWHELMEFVLPAIGHAEVMNLPDEPFRKWKYYDFFFHKETDRIGDPDRFLAAARKIFEKLGGSGWERYEPAFRKLFSFEGSLKDRCSQWKKAIALGLFGFLPDSTDKNLGYDAKKWFHEAFGPTEDPKVFVWKMDFPESHWVKFQKAAREQRTLVLDTVEKAGLLLVQNPLKVYLNKISFFLLDLFRIDGRKSFSWESVKRAAFRFCVYGSLLIFGEVAFYSIVKAGRRIPLDMVNALFRFEWLVDPRLNLGAVWDAPLKVFYGQASLWMFFVYASIGLFGIEPIYQRMKHQSWILRGLLYMFIILFMECATGWILRFVTGYDIWYYADDYDIFKYTSWAIAPMWFMVGLLSENFVRFVLKYNEKKAKLRKYECG